MVHIPILIFSFSYLRPCSLPQNYSCTYQRVPETNVLESNAVSVMFFDHVQLLQQLFFLKKDCCYRNNSGSGIRLHDGDLEHCLIKEKNRCLYVLFPIYMFWHSRFSFRNLKDGNSCIFSRCITNSRLLISSWRDMTLSQLLQ